MSDEKPQDPPKTKQGWTASEAAELAEAAARTAAARLAASKAAAEAAEKEYEKAAEAAAKAAADAEKEYEAEAAKVAAKVAAEASASFTDNRKQERIFRREMGEPEFFHTKKDLVPTRPVLTEDEQEEISRKVEIPTDQIPPYKPKHILSPEFGGTSNYESGITEMVSQTTQRLNQLKDDPEANTADIRQAEEDLKTLDYLYENFNIGMNVFRTAKGGRDKLRE